MKKDLPASFEQFKWPPEMAAGFAFHAQDALDLELLKTPDMPEELQEAVFKAEIERAMRKQRTAELIGACRIIDAQAEEIELLRLQLENQGNVNRDRGAAVWELLKQTPARFGARSLHMVEIMRFLQKEAPLSIRIKPRARNPYKLTQDAIRSAIEHAQQEGHEPLVEQGIGKKLKRIIYHIAAKIPKRPEPAKARRVPGQPREQAPWARAYTGFFRAIRDPDPGG
jgi:hypothetical protein